MAQNDNIYGLFDSMCQIDHYLVIWGQYSKKMYFLWKYEFLFFFKSRKGSKWASRNSLPESMIKFAQNRPKLSNFEIFGNFGGPKNPYERRNLQKMVTDFKITVLGKFTKNGDD